MQFLNRIAESSLYFGSLADQFQNLIHIYP